MSFKKGDSVKVHYVGTLEDGTVFDTSEGKEPLAFTIGSGELIPKFEESIIGKSSGDIIELLLTPEDAYGERDNNLLIDIERKAFGDIDTLKIGMPLTITTEEGPLEVFIAKIGEETVTIDGNSPLAGERLKFIITVQ